MASFKSVACLSAVAAMAISSTTTANAQQRLKCATYSAVDPQKMEGRSVHSALKIDDEIEAEQMYVTMSASAKRLGAVKAILHAYSLSPETNEIVHNSATLFMRNGAGASKITDAIFDPREEVRMPKEESAEPFTGKWMPGQVVPFRAMKAGELPLAGLGGSKGVWMLELEDVLEVGNVDSRMSQLTIDDFKMTFCDKDGDAMPENPMAVSQMAPPPPVAPAPVPPVAPAPLTNFQVMSVPEEAQPADVEEASPSLGTPLEVVPPQPSIVDSVVQAAEQTVERAVEAITNANLTIPASGVIPGVSIPLAVEPSELSPEIAALVEENRVRPVNDNIVSRDGVRIRSGSLYDPAVGTAVGGVPAQRGGPLADFIAGFFPTEETVNAEGDVVPASGPLSTGVAAVRTFVEGLPTIPTMNITAPLDFSAMPEIPNPLNITLPEIRPLNLAALPNPLNLTLPTLPEIQPLNLTEVIRAATSTDTPGPFLTLPEFGALDLSALDLGALDLSALDLSALEFPNPLNITLPEIPRLNLTALGIPTIPGLAIRLPFAPRTDDEVDALAESLAAEAADVLSAESTEAGEEEEQAPAGLFAGFQMPEFRNPFAPRETEEEVAAEEEEVAADSAEAMPVEEQAAPTLRDRLLGAANPQARPLGLFARRPAAVNTAVDSEMETAMPAAEMETAMPAAATSTEATTTTSAASSMPAITYEEEPAIEESKSTGKFGF
ncbi:hypothetical protein RI054_12g60200 [Pseudoscourfieldia marina]